MSKELEALKEFRKNPCQGVNVYADELLDIIESALELLEEFETLKNYYPPFKTFLKEMFERGHNEDLTNIKEWVEK